MYVLIAGGGKVGANLARSLLRAGHEVTLIEQRRDRFERLEDEFEHVVVSAATRPSSSCSSAPASSGRPTHRRRGHRRRRGQHRHLPARHARSTASRR